MTSQGSLGEGGKGSLNSARTATAVSEGPTLRSATSRTYLRALSAARFRTSLLGDCAPAPVSVAIRIFLSTSPARFPKSNTPVGDRRSFHRLEYAIQFLME